LKILIIIDGSQSDRIIRSNPRATKLLPWSKIELVSSDLINLLVVDEYSFRVVVRLKTIELFGWVNDTVILSFFSLG
jgi:hypothetical protein